MNNPCFGCGTSHHATHRACPGPNHDCWYRYSGCGATTDISSRGGGECLWRWGCCAFGNSFVESISTARRQRDNGLFAAIGRAASNTACGTGCAQAQCVSSVSTHTARAHTWSCPRVRKSGRFACVTDFLREMDTVKAGRSSPTVGQRLVGWARPRQFNWPDGSYQFCAAFGGARGRRRLRQARSGTYLRPQCVN